MSTLLVIGGSGFFGKSILDFFKRKNSELWGIDKIVVMSRNARSLKISAPELLDESIELVNADICTVNALPKADLVIHAAASTDIRNYVSRPDIEKQNIQAGIYNYCRLASETHAKSKIVYVSSGAVYGSQRIDERFLYEDTIDANLDDLTQHKRDYAIAKRDAEKAVQTLCEQGVSANIARCFAFIGPWLPRDQHFAIGNFIQDGLNRNPVRVRANYPVYRSYMHADDLTRWLIEMAVNSDRNCEVYNVGSNEEIELGQLAKLIAGKFKVDAIVPPTTEDKFDRYVPSIEKAKSKLNLNLEMNLEQAVDNTIDRILG